MVDCPCSKQGLWCIYGWGLILTHLGWVTCMPCVQWSYSGWVATSSSFGNVANEWSLLFAEQCSKRFFVLVALIFRTWAIQGWELISFSLSGAIWALRTLWNGWLRKYGHNIYIDYFGQNLLQHVCYIFWATSYSHLSASSNVDRKGLIMVIITCKKNFLLCDCPEKRKRKKKTEDNLGFGFRRNYVTAFPWFLLVSPFLLD